MRFRFSQSLINVILSEVDAYMEADYQGNTLGQDAPK
jgi:hypothetical protein